jgi:RNAse (barnase) inhibitor barstar
MGYSKDFLAKMNDALKDGYVGNLDKQLWEVVSNTFLSPEKALLVMMGSILTLFP